MANNPRFRTIRFTFPGKPRKVSPPMMPSALSQKVFLSRAQQKLMGQGTAIFTYHKIAKPPARTKDPFLYTTPEEFDRQLSALRAANYSVVTLGHPAASNPQSAPGTVVITFDDAFRNAFENGLEILLRHKIPAIQFIVSGAIGQGNHWDVAAGDVAEPLMDATQIKEWLAAG